MEKVRQGEQVVIKASTWNGFVDAANWVKEAKQNSLGVGIKSGIGGGIVPMKNMEETAYPRFSALVITGVAVSPSANEDEFVSCPTVFEGQKMTTEREDMPYAILLEPIEPGEIGRAMLLGLTPAKVSIKSAEDQYAVPKANSEDGALESSETGVARILWKAGGSGLQWCVLQLGGAGGGKPDEKVAMCKVTGGSSQSGYTVKVYPNGRSETGGYSYDSTLFVPDIALDSDLPSGTWIIGHKALLPATGGDDE